MTNYCQWPTQGFIEAVLTLDGSPILIIYIRYIVNIYIPVSGVVVDLIKVKKVFKSRLQYLDYS